MLSYDIGTKVEGINDTGVIIKKLPKSKVLVKWSNNFEQVVSYNSIRNKTARNRSIKIPPKDMPIGSIHKTKYGPLEILAYTNNKDVDVRFNVTGSVIKTSVDSIRRDVVKDPLQGTVYTGRFETKFYDVGDIIETKAHGGCKITKVVDAKDVTVVFTETGYEANTTMERLTRGHVKDYLLPTTYGRGFLGNNTIGKEHPDLRILWKDMMKRAYCKKYATKNTTYERVSVCKEWLDFREFVKWVLENRPVKAGKLWYLDKDLLVPGNKEYCPEKCCFIPSWLNSSHIYRTTKGYTINKNGRYTVQYRHVHIGVYDNEMEAINAYRYVSLKDVSRRVKTESRLDYRVVKVVCKYCKIQTKLLESYITRTAFKNYEESNAKLD